MKTCNSFFESSLKIDENHLKISLNESGKSRNLFINILRYQIFEKRQNFGVMAESINIT